MSANPPRLLLSLLLTLAIAVAASAQAETPAQQPPGQARFSLEGKEFPYLYEPASGGGRAPLLVVLAHPGSESAAAVHAQWGTIAASRGWGMMVVNPSQWTTPWTDPFVRLLDAAIADCGKRFPVNSARVFLAGLGDSAPGVFFAVSRVPHLWAAALAVHGSPLQAIATNRLFAANSQAIPLLWVAEPGQGANFEPSRQRLLAANFRHEWNAEGSLTLQKAFDWLQANARHPSPARIDCETGNPTFTRCHWAEVTRFDPALRNDVLASSRVPPGSGAYLGFGGFGYNLKAPGPGVLVEWLPENYSGSLRLQDRIVSIGGTNLKDAAHYVKLMDETTEEKSVAVVVQRGKERQRLETRIHLPRREELLTARLQAEFTPDTRFLLVITRGIAELKLYVPEEFVPAKVNWNGNEVANAETPGCLHLTGFPAAPKAAPCR